VYTIANHLCARENTPKNAPILRMAEPKRTAENIWLAFANYRGLPATKTFDTQREAKAWRDARAAALCLPVLAVPD
jgi:hypothetical protein